ncbi:flagellar hook-associated protein FlgK [Vibrio ziniensis]|uniref:Flagellar hook-associated protein 1 n=1 Tax=Vibrio ziniensis TaxID=2711221 RepID=A0A6G7CH93_9VIBR|nr:flagellar hook-associated protein FlgK [Vibrio ziniensis]QIH41485.1 flagellar hook-associated protein FlgK [Vibrio ziniensis]
MSMYSIGLSGLMANQIAMNVTAQNTANMTVTGYTRKTVEQATVVYGGSGNHGAGDGVTVASIRRVSDQAAINRLRLAGQEMQYSQTYMVGMQGLENILGMEGLNISTGFDEFFAALDESTLSPESVVYRNQILSAAKNLAARFNGSMSQVETELSTLMQSQNQSIETLNTQLQNIAKINEQIRAASGQGQDISSLQDALDLQLNEISKSVGVSVLTNSDGTVEIATKSGQPLVSGTNVAQISLDSSVGGAYNTDLLLTFNGQTVSFNNPKGGELGAIEDLATEQYLPMMEDLNNIAAGFADAVNALLTGNSATDLNGNPGQALFSYDPNNPASSLTITGITAEELALSETGSVGDGGIALAISDFANQTVTIGGVDTNVYDAYAKIIGYVGAATQQAQNNYNTASITISEAQSARDSISAVSSDEEAANLLMYMNAYQANMKVISTASQMFDTVLNSF